LGRNYSFLTLSDQMSYAATAASPMRHLLPRREARAGGRASLTGSATFSVGGAHTISLSSAPRRRSGGRSTSGATSAPPPRPASSAHREPHAPLASPPIAQSRCEPRWVSYGHRAVAGELRLPRPGRHAQAGEPRPSATLQPRPPSTALPPRGRRSSHSSPGR
jgi:hypothetical protein